MRYKSVLLEGIKADEKRLEKALRPKSPKDHAGYIYVIRVSEDKDNIYKIGRTKDLHDLLKTYNTGTVDGVEVVYKFRTDSYKKTEGCMKLMLKEYQLRKYKEVY